MVVCEFVGVLGDLVVFNKYLISKKKSIALIPNPSKSLAIVQGV